MGSGNLIVKVVMHRSFDLDIQLDKSWMVKHSSFVYVIIVCLVWWALYVILILIQIA